MIKRRLTVLVGLADGLEQRLDDDGIDRTRPKTRGDCVDAPRPCPWVGCRHHLYLEVSKAGSIKLNFGRLELEDFKETCSLDVADRGALWGQEVGALLGVTRQAVDFVESQALVALKRRVQL